MSSPPDDGGSGQREAEQAPTQIFKLQRAALDPLDEATTDLRRLMINQEGDDELLQSDQPEILDEELLDDDVQQGGDSEFVDEVLEQGEPGIPRMSTDSEPTTPDRLPIGLSQRLGNVGLHSPSLDENASIPDDTPSVRGSVLSSPRNGTSPQPSTSRKPTTPSRRPFDLRFQSRLSSTSLNSPRAGSPAFLTSHSRQSSLASQGFRSVSEVDDTETPWEVIRWHRLTRTTNQIFSEAARRNFGNATCLAVSDQVVIGTSKGLVLVFDHQQNRTSIIGSGTPAIEAGSVTSLAISADHTTIAAGHATGHIFTWEISKPIRPFLHIPPIDNSLPTARIGDGHVEGSIVLHVGFLGFRRTALVSADDRGMAFSHLATRGTGAIGRTVYTTRILGRYPELIVRSAKPARKSSVLAFSALPLGNVEQSTDSLGLVAMLTPYLLVIVSTTPVAQTQHKAARPKDVAAHSAMTAALAWFPAIKLKGSQTEASRTKLAYAWSDVLTVLEVVEVESRPEDDKEKQPELNFTPRNRFKAEEAIVAVQWLSRSVLAILTITQQLLIIEDVTMMVTDAFDLLPKNLYHADVYSSQLQSVVDSLDGEDSSMHGVVADAFHMSFRAYKGRLFLLGQKNIWWGSLTNWADRLLAMMDAGDFIGAIRLASRYYTGSGEKLTIGLPEEDNSRHKLVRDKILEMMSASLRYAFGQNQVASGTTIDQTQLIDLAVACINACLAIDDQLFLFDEVFNWYEDNGFGPSFIDVLEPAILDGKIRTLPPVALKTLINHFKTTHTSAKLEEVICLLDPRTMDIDQVTSLCKQYQLYDAYIYVWNSALADYVSPLMDLLEMTGQGSKVNGHHASEHVNSDVAQKLFAYISFILTGRVYPTGVSMDEDIALNAKMQVYDFLFSGKDSSSQAPNVSSLAVAATTNSFPRLRAILKIDASSFMSVMNEAFEDSFLNTGSDDDIGASTNGISASGVYNRQFLVQILLGVMSTGFDFSETIYLHIFIARNLPKYPQYMLLSGSALHETFMRLCAVPDQDLEDDAQLSVEYLLSVYQPPDPLSLVPVLRNARYYRVLKSVFRQEHHYVDLIETCLLDEENPEDVFDVIQENLRSGTSLTSQQRNDVCEVIIKRADDLAHINISRSALVMDDVLPSAHPSFIEALQDEPREQFNYLRTLLEPAQSHKSPSENVGGDLLALYIRLMCQFDAGHVVDYIKQVKEADLQLDAVLPAMEASGIVDATVILLAKHGQVRDAMDRLLNHITSLRNFLKSIIESSHESSSPNDNDEAVKDLLESIDRYCGVGIWICQGQTGNHQKSRANAKSPKRKSMTVPLSPEEQLWLDLLLAVVGVAQDVAPQPTQRIDERSNGIVDAIRTTIQTLFTALLTATTATQEGSTAGSDAAFLRILRAFLTDAAETSPSLSELRTVISSIFSAYAYEKSLLSLSNSMLDKDLFVHVDEVSKLRQIGWRPRGQVCEICKRRVWGPSTGLQIWKAWENSEQKRKEQRNLAGPSTEEVDVSRGKGKAAVAKSPASGGEVSTSDTNSEVPAPGPLIVFSCRHLYHRACLTQSQTLDGERSGEDMLRGNSLLRCPSCP